MEFTFCILGISKVEIFFEKKPDSIVFYSFELIDSFPIVCWLFFLLIEPFFAGVLLVLAIWPFYAGVSKAQLRLCEEIMSIFVYTEKQP